MADLPEMVSYFHEALRISLLVPKEWHGQLFEDARFRILGPPDPNFDQYRATLDIQLCELDPAEAAENAKEYELGENALTRLFYKAGEAMKERYPSFQSLKEEHFTLSSDSIVIARYYQWREEDTARQYSQIQALISSYHNDFYLFNAATLRPNAARDIPIFDAILHSIRRIPAATSITPEP